MRKFSLANCTPATNRDEPHCPEHQRTEVVHARAGNPGGDLLAGN